LNQETGAKTTAPGQGRLLSLDFFRGLTIAGMILVNNPGSWAHVYPPLLHAEWHGWTPTDLIFPFFLFIVGVSITLSLASRKAARQTPGDLYLKIARRSLILFALGIFLNGFPFYDLETLRIPGVLQRIAVCYCFAAVVFLNCGVKMQAFWTGALMLVYWAFMQWFPVPGTGAGSYAMGENFSAWLDSLVLGGHMWSQTGSWDPEGIFSTLPAISTTLFGVLAGDLLKRDTSGSQKTVWMLACGLAAVAAGAAWHHWLPINKNLWTSSYALFMSGMALLFLGVSYYLIDVRGWRRGTGPFRVYGMNAITVFVLSGIVGRLLYLVKWDTGSGPVTLKEWLFDTLFASWLSPLNASLGYALAFVFLSYLAMYYLYKKQIFIKV
jgi:predicted acyltransferase